MIPRKPESMKNITSAIIKEATITTIALLRNSLHVGHETLWMSSL